MDDKAVGKAEQVLDPDKRLACDAQLRTTSSLLHRP
jgi:hypothetical protein